jgi:ribosomal protein L37AE/L43A
MIVKTSRPSKSSKIDILVGYKWNGDVVTPIGPRLSKSASYDKEEVIVTAAGTAKMSKYHGEIAKTADGNTDLVAEMSKHPDALWIRVKAIEADQENDNGDYFSTDEVIKAHKTFEGCPVFTNHENNKVELAKGKVISAEWVPEERSVYCTMFIDRKAHPGLCRAIEEGYVTDVSMGTQVEYSTCSVCEKKAITADDYCDHVRTMKGRNANGRKVFEKNYGLKFIEISVVTDGACKDCTIREIIDPQDYMQPQMMRAADKIQEFVKTNVVSGPDTVAEVRILDNLERVADMMKTALMTKDSGQAEIQKLNQAMDLLEDVSRTMLDQRQYIDLEFLSKLVDVFADLQKVNDELVDQGYASVGGAPAAAGQPAAAFPPVPQATKEPAMEGTNPAATAPNAGGVGKITQPATASGERKTILAERLKELHTTAMKIYEEAKLSRGGDEVSTNKFEQTKQKVASIWNNPSVKKFQTEISEGEWKIAIGTEEVFGIVGTKKVASLKRSDLDAEVQQALNSDPQTVKTIGEAMLDALKSKYAHLVKEAEAAPVDGKTQLTQTFEAQLREQKPPLHPRENEVRDVTTEGQLAEKHHDYEFHKRQEEPRTATTEHQLHKEDHHGYEENQKPQDKPRTATFEKQLRDTAIPGNSTPAEGGPFVAGVTDQVAQTHEGQLEDWKKAQKNKNVAPDSTTEKQLRDQGDPLGRRIASKEDAKLVLATAMKAFVRTAAATAATPDEMILSVASMTSSPEGQIEAAKIVEASSKDKEARESFIQRASFHGAASLKVASKADVKNFLLGSISDLGLDSKAGVSALKVLASQKDASKKIAEAVTAGIEEQAQAEAPVSMEDMLKEALADTSNEQSLKVVIAEKEVGEHKDEESFAKAAFEVASKLAASEGLKAIASVHVAKKGNGNVEVEMKAVKVTEEKKEASTGTTEKKASVDVAARKEERNVLAQVPTGGGMPAPGADAGGPPAGGGGTTMPAAGAADPTGGVPPVSALGGEDDAGADDGMGGGGGEALPPGSICPVCGSDDVDIRAGEFDCNSCGATGSFSVKIEVESWPTALEDKGSGAAADEAGGGLGGETPGGDMGMGAETGGQEMPPVGIQAAFKVTPEMVKVAKNKPIGSFCPHCGSDNVKLASKSGSAIGTCQKCSGTYAVDTYVDAANLGELWATVQWQDMNIQKMASKSSKPMDKKASLENALKSKGLEAKFAKADLAGKADIIALLHDEGLLK